MEQAYDFYQKMQESRDAVFLVRQWWKNKHPNWYQVTPTKEQDKDGCDFYYIVNDRLYSVQVKADFQTAETGNVAIETMSKEEFGKIGWAWIPFSDWFVYVVVGTGKAYVCKSKDVCAAFHRCWHKRSRNITMTKTDFGYWHTTFVLIPLQEFIRETSAKEILLDEG